MMTQPEPEAKCQELLVDVSLWGMHLYWQLQGPENKD